MSKNSNAIKNLKIFSKVLQFSVPYVITAGIVIGGFSLAGFSPFSLDEHRIYAKVKTEVDNNGNTRSEEQYGNFKDGMVAFDESNSVINYCSKWEPTDDGRYTRTIQDYAIKGKSLEDITELLKKEDLKLEDVFGKPVSNLKIIKENLTEDEKQEEAFIKAVIYNEDKNEYIVHKETVGENVVMSLVGVVLFGTLGIIPTVFSKDKLNRLESDIRAIQNGGDEVDNPSTGNTRRRSKQKK